MIDPGTKKALIISVSDYDNPKLDDLEFCKNDGEEMYSLLKSLGYQILDRHRLIGNVKSEKMKSAIYDFFDNRNNEHNDTLFFYYSGHGILTNSGDDVCLASSEIDDEQPKLGGFPSYDLTECMQESDSSAVVLVLDCCYSGTADVKGDEEEVSKMAYSILKNKTTIQNKLQEQGEGRCILAACQATQGAFKLKEKNHSIFTYYLLEGLKKNEKSTDQNGNVTAFSLGSYISIIFKNLPSGKRPRQKPIIKVESSGDLILATYPRDHVRFPTPSQTPKLESIEKSVKQKFWTRKKIVVSIGVAAALSILIYLLLIGLMNNHHKPNISNNHPPIAVGQNITSSINKNVNIKLNAKDEDTNDNLRATLVTNPIHGRLTPINQDTGFVTYIPNSGFTGSDSFVFKVNDSKNDSNSAKVMIIIKDNSLMAINQSVETSINKPIGIILAASDSIVNANDTLNASIITRPLHGSLGPINQDTGFVTYIPISGFTGNDNFTFKVSNGLKDSNSIGKISVLVNNKQS